SRASFFFFSSRRRHTRSLRDWSSDVCSSDLYSVRIHPCGIEEGKMVVFLTGRRKVIPTNAEIRREFCSHFPGVVEVERPGILARSEERRVGKECRAGRSPEHENTNHTNRIAN